MHHMLRRVGQRCPFVVTTLLLSVGIGIVAANTPVLSKAPAGRQLDTPGFSLADVIQLVVGAVRNPRVTTDGHRRSAVDLVLELGEEYRGVGFETLQVVKVGAYLVVGAFFWFQVRCAYGQHLTLPGDIADAIVQIIDVRGFITLTDTTLEGPAQ